MVIEAVGQHDLEIQAEQASEVGYSPVGGPSMAVVPSNGGCGPGFRYMLMMVRKATSPSDVGNTDQVKRNADQEKLVRILRSAEECIRRNNTQIGMRGYLPVAGTCEVLEEIENVLRPK